MMDDGFSTNINIVRVGDAARLRPLKAQDDETHGD